MKRGYKAMNSDMTCLGFKFEVGKTYKTQNVKICEQGFHYCQNLMDVYNYYPKSENTIITEIEDNGNTIVEGDKSVTDSIKIIRVLTDKEVLAAWINRNNSSYGNSGYGNSGYGNSGYRNSGYRNSGYGNSGNWNSGDRNSGDRNSGYGNSGYGNSGNWNSGYGNSGNWNSGDWNSGDRNSGYFNTKTPLYFFNKPSNIEYTKELENKIRSINVKPILEWVETNRMTEKEQNDNPSHKTTGGFLRKTDRHDFRYLTKEDKEFIKSLPNYDDEVFKVISGGVSLLEEMIEITVNGKVKQISKAKAKEAGLIEE